MNAPVVRLFGLVVVLFARAGRLHVALDGVRRRGAAREPGEPPRSCCRSSGSSAASIRAADGAVLAALARDRAGALRAAATRPDDAVRPPGRLLLDRPRARPASRTPTTTRCRAARRRRIGAISTAARPAGRRATTSRRRSRRRPRRRPTRGSNGRAGAVVALDVHTGAVRVLAGDAVASTRTTRQERRRPSTARRRAATRRARRSRR